jgi:hypothetical protein
MSVFRFRFRFLSPILIQLSLISFLIQHLHGAPNVTTITPSELIGEEDQYLAEGSDFFPNQYKAATSSVKFPEEEGTQSQSHHNHHNHNTQTQTAASEQLDDIDEKTAIDIILAATKSGRSFDVGEGTEELSKVTSDPRIKAEIAVGNDAQARGYIRDKLCDLGLMPVSKDSNKGWLFLTIFRRFLLFDDFTFFYAF